jgi:hypothetical protein
VRLAAPSGSTWHNYRHAAQAPCVGCGNCGHVVLLTKPFHDPRNAAFSGGSLT